MSIQLKIEEKPDYLSAKFIGAGAAEEICRQFELIAERCKRANKNKLLLDFTEAYCGSSLAERYFLGDQAETFMFHNLIKVAVDGRLEQLDHKRFGEMVARNRWVNARVFTNVRAAKRWLLLKPATPRKRRLRATIIGRNPDDHGHH